MNASDIVIRGGTVVAVVALRADVGIDGSKIVSVADRLAEVTRSSIGSAKII